MLKKKKKKKKKEERNLVCKVRGGPRRLLFLIGLRLGNPRGHTRGLARFRADYASAWESLQKGNTFQSEIGELLTSVIFFLILKERNPLAGNSWFGTLTGDLLIRFVLLAGKINKA